MRTVSISKDEYCKRAPIAALVVLCSVVALAQSPRSQDAPREVVQKLFRMADDGVLTTPDGWKRAGTLFVSPTLRPHDQSVAIVSKNYSVNFLSATDRRAEVYVGYEDLGRIDSTFRYVPADPRFFKTAVKYHLVLMNAGSEREWKIENPQGSAWTGVDAAIRYVTEMREKAADPVVRKNADATLAVLKKLNGSPGSS